MIGKLEAAYDKVTGEGVTINDLYIYSRIIEDMGRYGTDELIEELFKKIKYNYANDYDWRGLDYHINAVLNDVGADILW